MSLTHFAPATSLLWKYLESTGINPEPIYIQAGIKPELLLNPNARININSVDALWEQASREYPFTDMKGVDWQALYDEFAPRIAEAEANILAIQKETDHIKNTITLEVEEAYMNAVTANNQIQLYETEILSQAEEVYNMFLFSYQEGEIGSIELIAARRTLLESARSYADALFNYEVALATLERSIGQTLEGERQ